MKLSSLAGAFPKKLDCGRMGETSFIGLSWSNVYVFSLKLVLDGMPADSFVLIMLAFFQLTV